MQQQSLWPKQNDRISLLLVGETNVNREIPEEAFSHVLPTLLDADVLFGHLECPVTHRPSMDPDVPDIVYKSSWKFSKPSMIQAWKSAAFSAVSCASNVMYGEKVVRDTLESLDEYGIAHCGAGLTFGEARKPAIVECKGTRFGFLSYTSVFWPVGLAAGLPAKSQGA